MTLLISTPNPSFSIFSSIHASSQLSATISLKDHHHCSTIWSSRRNLNPIARAALDSSGLHRLGFTESDGDDCGSDIPRPNRTVMEAQARICARPMQVRPLGEEHACEVLDTILKSVKGELKEEEEVSRAQLGAFFAAMAIRANAFPECAQWSEGEMRAMDRFWPVLVRALPYDVTFIADPEGSTMGGGSSIGPQFVGNGIAEMRLVGALREVLAGGHLGFDEVQGVIRDVLPLEDRGLGRVRESLLSAFMIGQGMNGETDRELKAYCLAFDDELGNESIILIVVIVIIIDWCVLFHKREGPPPIADVRSLTHYGEPYDGNLTYFKSTLFVAAVRACYGESSLLHGVEWMPPKGGVTEEQVLKSMGANTHLSPSQAKELLEDEDVGFAYLSQREARPSLYSVVPLREHIKMRPPIAIAEKVQQFVRTHGREAIVSGIYHADFEGALLMLMRRRGVHSGLVVKGEEGALSLTTGSLPRDVSNGFHVNCCSGFRSCRPFTFEADGVSREIFNVKVTAQDYGFKPTDTPKTNRSVSRNVELGLAALRGEKGPAYDRIVLNAGMVDHLLGCDGAEDITIALERAREAIDSGKALDRIMNYIRISHKVK
ncbi:hypothetical protein Scep_017886 [Stephania cephalantha]|uniref:Anthranilate phosphoribosyltransferase n=1 Tax=Stephania cephalantha TaxID=152367 RepID=A0AAP0IRQ8_9MAGN